MTRHDDDRLADDRTERECDRIVELLGRHFASSPDSPLWCDEQLFEWLAREAHEGTLDRSPPEAVHRRQASGVSPGEPHDSPVQRPAANSARRPSDPDAWCEEEIISRARALRAAVAASRAPVRRMAGAPTTRAAGVPGVVQQTLDAAASARCAPCLELAAAAGAGRALWDELCEAWVELPADLPPGRYLALGVSGESMLPLLHAGDVILVRLGAQGGLRLERGAVVVARLPDDGYVVKRVGRVLGSAVELESLHADYPPVRVPRRADAVLGTVVLRWCAHDAGRHGMME